MSGSPGQIAPDVLAAKKQFFIITISLSDDNYRLRVIEHNTRNS